MRGLKLRFLLIILTFSSVFLYSQNPSYFKIGEDELSGIDIYDILQDKNQVYWLATNQGIIKFDGYHFEFIQCAEMLNNSVFSLKTDASGAIFCNNLSGQIFKIQNNHCEVFFQLPDSLMSSYLYYEFDELNNLVIGSNSLFRVTPEKQIEMIIPKNYSTQRFSEIFKTKEKTLLTFDGTTKNLIKLEKGKLYIDEVSNITGDEVMLQYFYLNNKLYCFNIFQNTFIYEKDSIIKNIFPFNDKKKKLIRFYSDNNYLWVSKQSGGVNVFNKNFEDLFNGNTIFESNLISSIYKDREGNSILGTFGEGLIVVSDFNSIELNLPEKDNKITRITKGNNEMFIGTQSGNIYKVSSNLQVSLSIANGEKNIELLEFIPETNQLLFDKKYPTFIDIGSKKEIIKKYGAIKDIFSVSKNLYLISANNGVSWIEFINNQPFEKHIPLYKERTNCIGYDSINKTIYAGTSMGLKIGNEDNSDFFLLNNKTLICKDILYFKGKIYITTQNNGILIFENNQLIGQWTTKNGLISNTIKNIKHYQNHFYISTNLGLQILDEKGESIYILNKSNGLYTNTVIDFEINNNKLWLVHQKGVQIIDINQIQETQYTPTISFTKIQVNDSVIQMNKQLNFDYTHNKFEFVVSSISLKYSDEITYHYKLDGLDEKWQINNYHDNRIEYKSLPAGKYTFLIKAVYRNQESETLSYAFQISPPFWARWWFYFCLASLFIFITLIVYRYQLKKQRNKIKLQNELNASKLIAIQSQMNPHFIFNSINSIQDLILQGDVDNSYSYIIKFSKLVRQTLHFSNKEFIDIEDEIELLNIYLELEKLRFKNDFEYEITIGEVEDIQVPPMLIQPFVENAIKHGLLHKEGIKKLKIEFEKKEILTCTVTDNGIGRKKAMEINERQRKQHQSFSVNATKARFDIMKEQYRDNLGIEYFDLTEKNEAVGTKVVIKIPFRQNY